MKMYGVDMRALSSDERTVAYDELHAYGEVPIDIMGKSGFVEAVVVGWSDNASFPGSNKILSTCCVIEIPPGYLEAYQEKFR